MESSTINIAVKADTTKFTEAISKTEAKAAKFKEAWTGSITAVSTAFLAVNTAVQQFVIAPLSGAVNAFVGLGDTLAKTSQRIGISTESLGGLKYAAEQCGSNFDEATDAIKTFQEQLGAAKLGDTGAIGKLGAVGIDAREFEGLSNEEQFLKLADHIASIGDRAKQTRTAIELFGEAGYKLLPFFQEGSSGIRKLMEEGKSVGAVLGEEGVDAAVDLSGAMTRLQTSASNIGNTFLATLAPAITTILDSLSSLCKLVSKFVSQYGTAIASIGAGIAVFAGWNTALTGLTAVFPAIVAGVKSITVAMMANPYLAVGAVAIGALVAGWNLWNQSIKETEARLKAVEGSAAKLRGELEAAEDPSLKLFERLKQLSEITDPLKNSELEEAKKLIDALEGKYGDLGLSIDAATGKIKGLTTAQAAMLKQMAAQRKLELDKKQEELSGTKLEVEQKRAKEMANVQKYKKQLSDPNLNPQAQYNARMNLESSQKLVEEYNGILRGINKEKSDLLKQQTELRDGTFQPGSKPAEASREKSLAQLQEENTAAREAEASEKAEAQKKLEGLKDDPDLDFRDDLTKAYADLETRYNEKIKALEERIALTEQTGGDTSSLYDQYNLIEQWRQNELAKIGEGEVGKRQEQADKEYAAWQERNPELDKLEEKDPRLVKAEAKVQAAEDKQAETILKGGNLEKADAELAAAKRELTQTVAEVSGEARLKAREELEAAQGKYNKALANGSDNKTINELAQAVRDAQTKYDTENSAYLGAVGELRSQNETDLNDAVSTTLSSSGTFSAYGMDATVSSNIPQQTLDVLRKLLDNTDEIKEEQKNDGAFSK